MRIEGTDGEVLGPGETGQVVVTAPGQMIGIYGDDEATAARVTEDGWIRTGDVGQIDEDGFLRLMDRMEDVIISGGFNIWPAEIEKALVGYPGVREAVVFGVPHPKWGETPVAVVHADPAAPMTRRRPPTAGPNSARSKKPTSVHFLRTAAQEQRRQAPAPRCPQGLHPGGRSVVNTARTDLLDLLIKEASKLTADVLELTLVHPDGEELPAWTPGAHVDVLLPAGKVRTYSLCGDPADRSCYRIAVLRVADGRGGSNFMTSPARAPLRRPSAACR